MKRRWSSLQLDKDSKRTNFCHVNHSWWPREFWEVVKNKHCLINWMQKVLLHIRNVRNESVEDISRKKGELIRQRWKGTEIHVVDAICCASGLSKERSADHDWTWFYKGQQLLFAFRTGITLRWRYSRVFFGDLQGGGGPKLRKGHWFALNFYKVIIKAIWRDQYIESHLGQT